MISLSGLYAITPDVLIGDPDRLCEMVEAALQGGAALLQYRDKRGDASIREHNARALNDLCRRHGAALIINDDLQLAEKVAAAGVHLGANDGSIAEARRRLGPAAIIGATCGPSLERGRRAAEAGASYIAFGRFFPSRTKPDAPGAEFVVLRQAHEQLQLPICAIGGVTPENGRSLLDAGADLLAAVEGVFGHRDPEQVRRAAAEYVRLFAP